MEPVVLIAGVTGGIGSALARRLAAKGVRVAGFARGGERLAALAAELPGAQLWAADATAPETAAQAVAQTVGAYGRLDGVVHAVGSIILKPAHLLRDEEFMQTLEVNLVSAFRMVRAAVSHLQRQPGGGSVILFSSVAAQAGLPNHEAIAAAKGGIDGLVLAAAATYANRAVRVNAIAPGLVETPLSAGLLANEAARKISEAMHPLGRVGRADEVASLAEWLLSPDAAWMTGQILSLDGGLGHLRQRPKA